MGPIQFQAQSEAHPLTIAMDHLERGAMPSCCAGVLQYAEPSLAFRRLSEAYRHAHQVPFDDDSRFVFFSDCHRGDSSRADAFAHNEELFLHTLDNYYRRGFTYVEVGDGDELWKNRRFLDVHSAHKRSFDLLHQFDQDKRLHILVGNHDITGHIHEQVNKDGMIAKQSLVLRHVRSGQRFLVIHGHQADFFSSCLYRISRIAVRFWRYLQLMGLVVSPHTARQGVLGGHPIQDSILAYATTQIKRIERRLIEWAVAHQQSIICGHTHNAMIRQFGQIHYLNTGSCVTPGLLTGIELAAGQLRLVAWRAKAGTTRCRQTDIVRTLLAPARGMALAA